MSAFIDERRLRQDAAGANGPLAPDRSSPMLDPAEATEIAKGLIAKYGADALAFGQGRARRALEVEDDLALAAWRAVIANTRALLSELAEV
jgi:hypothetical protein